MTTGRTIPVTTRVARASDAATIARTLLLGVQTYVAFATAESRPVPPPDEVEMTTAQLAQRETWALLAVVWRGLSVVDYRCPLPS